MNQQSLQKFGQLPSAIKNTLSSPAYLGAIEQLEQQYQARLTMLFIGLVVGDILPSEIENNLKNNYQVESEAIGVISRKFSQLLADLKKQFPAELGLPSNRAAFAFAVEDEQEINQFKNFAAAAASQKYNYDQLADLVITEFGYHSQEGILTKRLHNIVVANLRQVRDDLETRDGLLRSQKVGGLELSAEQTDRLMKIIKNKLNQNLLRKEVVNGSSESGKASAAKVKFPDRKPFSADRINLRDKIKSAPPFVRNEINHFTPPRPSPYKGEGEWVEPVKKLSEPNFTAPKNLSEKIFDKLPYIKEVGGLPVIRMPQDELTPKARPNIVGPIAPVAPQPNAEKIFRPDLRTPPPLRFGPASPRGEEASPPPPRPLPQPVRNVVPPKALDNQFSRKPKLDDVRFAKRLAGPIEELGNMTLIDFRRLAPNPEATTAKIKEKIDLLERESYARRIEGINAWHSNEVNKFYRLLGQKSLTEGRGLEIIINERLNNNKPTLSIGEFNAIMELNKQLRF